MSRSSSEPSTLSQPSGRLAQLTDEQQQRLTDVLDRYLLAQERGTPLSQPALFADHPDLADMLRLHFRSLEDLHDMAAGFGAAQREIERPRPTERSDTRRLGDFELVREIGRGGMGVVYEAWQISLQRRVAVKLLPFAAVLDAKQIARFKHEAQAAAQLHHPNIVPVFAIGVERGIHYYAMQFIDGQPLDRAIAELRDGRGRRSNAPRTSCFEPSASVRAAARTAGETRDQRQAPTQPSCLASAAKNRPEYFRAVIRLGIQAAEALHAAHEYGVVHRDIKPSNLLLEADGKLWVTDFGLARFQRDVTLTRTGDLVGTMRYMSPEQAAGHSALVDHRSDIYSLGATLYELLLLRPAFAEQDGPRLLRRIERDDPPNPRQVRPEIPSDLENVVLKCMAKDRQERYATARQLAADLLCVLEGRPTVAKPPTTLDRFTKWARRHRRIACAGLGALVLVVIGLTVSTLLIAREKSRAEHNVLRADRFFRDARDVLDRFGVELSERLADVPGAEKVRNDLLQQTRRYYEEFVEEAKNDSALRAEMALTYGKIASLLDDGSADQAVQAHEKAMHVFEELAAAEPGNLDHQKQLALSINNLAHAVARTGQTEKARQHFADAIRRQRQLQARLPHDETLLADLAMSLSNLGLLQMETGQAAEAQSAYHSAIDLLRQLLHARPDDPQRQRKLAAAYNNLAASCRQTQPQKSAELHQQALALQVAASTACPADLTLRRDVALTFNNLGAALARLRQGDAALECYQEAITVQEVLVRRAPALLSYQRDLAVSHNNIGLVHSRAGRIEEAETAFRRSLEFHETLLREQPDDVAVQSGLGGVYNNLGIVLEQSGRHDEAAAAFTSAIDHQRAALSRAPKVGQFRDFLNKHLFNYGRVLRELGRSDEAVRAALARRELWAGQGNELFSVAEELATACAQFQAGPASTISKDQCARLAVSTLEESVAAGYQLPPDLENRQPFAALNDLPQFAKLARREP